MTGQFQKENIAVIDLGTNTAHILIANAKEGQVNVVYKKRHYTFLAENGIERISEEAITRLYAALTDFQQTSIKYEVKTVRVTGTEAFRKASNGVQIVNTIQEEYGWPVEIISGDREAELIYKGVQNAIDITDGNYLIMDIGGGSVEFILSSNGSAAWKRSFPIGIANIYNSPWMRDSLSEEDINNIKGFIHQEIEPLKLVLEGYSLVTLIGAAGSFEILTQDIQRDPESIYSMISKKNFLSLMNDVIHLSREERAKVSWIPVERAQYVTAAIILIQVAIDICSSEEILISPYALKEGLASEVLHGR